MTWCTERLWVSISAFQVLCYKLNPLPAILLRVYFSLEFLNVLFSASVFYYWFCVFKDYLQYIKCFWMLCESEPVKFCFCYCYSDFFLTISSRHYTDHIKQMFSQGWLGFRHSFQRVNAKLFHAETIKNRLFFITSCFFENTRGKLFVNLIAK